MRIVRSAAALTVVLVAAAGCASDRSEVRVRCDGPNMVYEAWVDEPGWGGLEFSHIDVVPGDPRCAGATPAPAPTPSPSEQ
ncbi:hypothetical protein J2S43_001982 [Catenuloplanes nepalensis]|uniref:Lipoprotein n=1 Tax=Catenuloplanes nepalensis TaxID=587533 RepID=A0ABT9MPX9_9ACTN|nr:hypothetical protein [Catenuloplanes nepalensis]MDP9793470.1 hypothetical protein [Catenuloplanes nepalensis]